MTNAVHGDVVLAARNAIVARTYRTMNSNQPPTLSPG
jgi:hypothetical protein